VGAAIGPGLPLGIGAAMAGKGRKTIAMVGDGGFALNLPELWTAVQEQVELVIMVMNDKGYGVIRHIQDHAAGRRFFHDLQGPDLMQLAALAGLPGRRVSAVEEFGPALERAFAMTGPVLLEIDMATIGEHPPYAPYNQARKAS
jgi:acetolactate synthase-1/2/3 large subunit